MVKKLLHKPQAVIGLFMITFLFVIALFAPVIAPHDPLKTNIINLYASPSFEYPLGTDEMGRCILSRLIYGARESMSIALPAIVLIAFVSIIIGTISAYFGGIIDKLFTVAANIFMALPPFLIAATLVGTLDSTKINILLSIIIATWVWFARVVRVYVQLEKNKPYIITCRMSGCGDGRIIMNHIIPNIFPHIIVYFSTSLSGIIIMISGYAFLGLGLSTGSAEWGDMFLNAKQYIYSAPQLLIYPGLCILFASAGFNLFGEALRDICQTKEG